MAKGYSAVEPSEEAESEWVNHMRETAVDLSAFVDQCPPSYYNNEGQKVKDENGNEIYRNFLGETYGLGWSAFENILKEWRASGDLPGMIKE